MSTPKQPGVGRSDALSFVPPIWLGYVLLSSAWGIVQTWPVAFEADLPAEFTIYFYVNLAASAVTVLWGLWPMALAFGRSPAFGKAFIPWQMAVIVMSLAVAAYALAALSFEDPLRLIVYWVAEIAIGIFCIAILRREVRPEPAGVAPLASAPAARPSALATVAGAILGLLVGGAVGAGIGLLAGTLIAEVANISCFEGGCGYFVVFIGFGGLLVGAVAGAILAVWLIRRRHARGQRVKSA